MESKMQIAWGFLEAMDKGGTQFPLEIEREHSF